MRSNKWIRLADHPPHPDDIVRILDDGKGAQRIMRIPCVALIAIKISYPGLDIKYQLVNHPDIGDYVLFDMPVERCDRGIVYAGSSMEFFIRVDGTEIDIHRLENEVMLLSDYEKMERLGTPL